jgi:hypothetical protein
MRPIATGVWIFGQSNLGGSSGLIGRVVKLQLEDGLVVYTRETLRGIDSFSISSGERWGDKAGKVPRKERQALDLWAPADRWEEVAAIVKDLDPLRRPVMRNKNFTPAWAEEQGLREVE